MLLRMHGAFRGHERAREHQGAHHMRIAKLLPLTAIAAVMLGILSAGPAAAAPTDDSVVTFEVLAGTLDIVAPVAGDLGDGAPGSTISAALGAIAVTDDRALTDASWVAEVTSTDFTTGDETASETIPAASVGYASAPAGVTTGNGTFIPGQLTAGDLEPLDTAVPLVAFTHDGGSGNNSATWNPAVAVTVLLEKAAGIYTGTVTHSVG